MKPAYEYTLLEVHDLASEKWIALGGENYPEDEADAEEHLLCERILEKVEALIEYIENT